MTPAQAGRPDGQAARPGLGEQVAPTPACLLPAGAHRSQGRRCRALCALYMNVSSRQPRAALGRNSCSPHFEDEKTKASRLKSAAPSSMAKKGCEASYCLQHPPGGCCRGTRPPPGRAGRGTSLEDCHGSCLPAGPHEAGPCCPGDSSGVGG